MASVSCLSYRSEYPDFNLRAISSTGCHKYLTPNGVCDVTNGVCGVTKGLRDVANKVRSDAKAVCGDANAVYDAASAVCDAANGRGASQKIYEKIFCRAEGPAIFFSYAATAKFGFATQTPFATPQAPFETPQMAGGHPKNFREKKLPG